MIGGAADFQAVGGQQRRDFKDFAPIVAGNDSLDWVNLRKWIPPIYSPYVFALCIF